MNGEPIWRVAAAAIVLLALVPVDAWAIQCRIRVGAINFGTYMPLTTTHVDVIGQFEVRCQAQPGTFAVIIGPGLSGDQTARTLVSATGEILFYNLYVDAARTQIWGDGTPPTLNVTGARLSQGRPTVFNYPVYGRIFANQAPNPGQYADDPVATVLF